MATNRSRGRANSRNANRSRTRAVNRPDSRVVRAKAVEREEAGERRAREEYGGFNIGASFFGWLVSVALGTLLTGIVAAAGSAVALTQLDQTSVDEAVQSADAIGIASGLILLLVLALAYYAGGYVAGRMSRFDGGRQGLGVWVIGLLITLLLAGAGAIAGAQYNVLQQINLPTVPVDGGSFAEGGLIATLVILVVSLLAAIAGGKTGEGYHRKVDAA